MKASPSTQITAELNRIREVADKATAGPWRKPDSFDDGHDIYAGRLNAPVKVAGNYDYEEGGICEEQDRDFIIASRDIIPRLLRVIEHMSVTIDGLSMTSDTGESREKWCDRREAELAQLLTGDKL